MGQLHHSIRWISAIVEEVVAGAILLETSGSTKAWETAVLTRHGVAVKVISDGLLQLVVGRGLLEALAQVVLQVLVQFASCRQRNTWWVKTAASGLEEWYSQFRVATLHNSTPPEGKTIGVGWGWWWPCCGLDCTGPDKDLRQRPDMFGDRDNDFVYRRTTTKQKTNLQYVSHLRLLLKSNSNFIFSKKRINKN